MLSLSCESGMASIQGSHQQEASSLDFSVPFLVGRGARVVLLRLPTAEHKGAMRNGRLRFATVRFLKPCSILALGSWRRCWRTFSCSECCRFLSLHQASRHGSCGNPRKLIVCPVRKTFSKHTSSNVSVYQT